MGSNLNRRMARIEAALMPAPVEAFTVLTEPDDPGKWQEHRQQIEEARRLGHRVGIVIAKYHDERSRLEGVEYFANETEAGLAAVASQPSSRGKANRLVDLLDSLSGNTLGVPEGESVCLAIC